MIKVEELRCGNLVEFKGQHVPIVKIDSQNELIDQDAILSYKGSVVVPEYSPDGRIWNYNSPWVQQIKPIPLTEEWLLKLGFWEKYKSTCNRWYLRATHLNSGCEIIDPEDDDTGKLTGKFYYRNSDGDIDVPYVHQLQNLYYAITKEELTIK